MRVIKNKTEYIERRLAEEEVIPRAYLYGLTAVEKGRSANEVMVISISSLDYSAYIYEIKEGNFRIISFQENVQHDLSDILNNELLDEQTLTWWKTVFFEIDGRCIYDSSYDNLRITENNNNQTFKEILQSVEQSFERMEISQVPSIVCLTGEYSTNPLLRYVMQEKLVNKNGLHIISFEDITPETFQGSQNRIILPSDIKSIFIRINEGLNMETIMWQPMSIKFPLQCIDNVLVDNITWNKLVSDKNPDYNVGNLEFKHLSLLAECDVYGDIFFSCEDIHDNKVIVKL